ncbi:MAG TPA: hypothetical protein VEF72_25450 [Mycobacterium sp.]|nr:hypothetical protein [Mycobacterium sp.]
MSDSSLGPYPARIRAHGLGLMAQLLLGPQAARIVVGASRSLIDF